MAQQAAALQLNECLVSGQRNEGSPDGRKNLGAFFVVVPRWWYWRAVSGKRGAQKNQITPSQGHKQVCGSQPLAPLLMWPSNSSVKPPGQQAKEEIVSKSKVDRERERGEKREAELRERSEMSENRDPAIKLFGMTIPLHPVGDPTPLGEKDVQNKSCLEFKENIEPPKSTSSESSGQPSTDKDDGSVDEPATDEQPEDQSNPKQKTLKKPDKILPCPRCKSMDTKFCYYNNYNINQPRHFCKNCQRYWTAGGTMRNVPVGAGRRKNKHSTSQYRHLAVTNPSFQAVVPDLIPYALKPNGTVLSFGSDMPLRGPVASVLTVAEKNTKSCNRNGFHHQMEDKRAPPCCSTENGDAHSSRSSEGSPKSEGAATNNSSVIDNKATQDSASAPCFNGTPWLYSWIPAPAFCASSFPVPFYPAAAAAAYWSCPVPPGTLSVPWVPQPPASSAMKTWSQGAVLAPISPTLGKRSRDGDTPANDTAPKKEANGKQESQGRCIWTPKALRIDDPEEAAKSSIWTMVGAKNGKVDAVSGGCLFKAFHPSDNVTNHAVRSSQLLHANPAALSRSLNFQESS